MLKFNPTLIQSIAKDRINERIATQRERHVTRVPSTLGNTPIVIRCQVNNASLAVFPGKVHNIDHPLLHKGDMITVTRRMTHGFNTYIFFFTTSDGLEGFIHSSAVTEIEVV